MEWNRSQSQKGIEKYIRDQLRARDSFEIEDKINFTATIIDNIILVPELHEFDREECQVTLIDWIWKERLQLKGDNYQSELLRDLLFNVIIIFESIPLSIKDITAFRFIEKLKVMRGLVKGTNVSIACRIGSLVGYWAKMVNEVKTEVMLNRKRERMTDEDITDITGGEDEDTDCSSIHCKKKKVTWNEALVDVVEFCSDSTTSNIETIEVD